ncbi:magnesium transporter [Escherichia coli]|nr:magnesium transporter [Escherichia coli]
MLRKIKRVTDTLKRQGLRVVAVATKDLPTREGDYQRADQGDLHPQGTITFLDHAKNKN